MRSTFLIRGLLVAATAFAVGACSDPSDPGNSGTGAGSGFDTTAAIDTGVAGKDTTDAATTADAGTADTGTADSGSGGDATTPDDTTAGTDQDSVTETAGGTDQDTATAGDTTTPDDTATAGDTAVGGCKEDKDCPASTIACKKATCDAATGVCGTADLADAAECDDANACTTGDKCGAGLCVAGAAKDCDDVNDCTTETCDPVAGCKHDNNTQQCSDNSECTTADACKDGKCEPGPAKVCDDGNPCTDDKCDAKNGCESANNTAECSDGNACTSGEKCAAGACAGGTGLVCDDKNACTADSCDPKVGCKNDAAADGSSCDDGDACSATDVCAGGKCAGTALNCDDKNACTKDTCDKVTGCASANDDAATCDDGNSCTTGDKCSAGACAGTGKDCNDSNVCTDDSCKDNVCTNAANAAACDDGDKCTQGDTCEAKACTKNTAVACDDNNPCTTNACDKAAGTCTFANNNDKCDDASACTTADACKDGACGGTAIVCDDKNSCTSDSCDKVTGKCTTAAAADGANCDDGSACSQNDACAAGACKGGAVKCDDGNPCTDDTCDAVKGCAAAPNTAACEDGSACTKGDKCAAGKCTAGTLDTCDDKNPCTTDAACDKVAGCVHKNNADKCTDADACTDADVCTNGVCGGVVKKCDDSNLCTTDSCDKVAGCKFANNTALCNDGSVCTSSDICAAGKCVGSAPITCNDNNACTTDTCDAKVGCLFKAAVDGGKCDDGNGCTINDACKTGKCLGAGKSCDDNNVCTTDSCAADKCTNANNKSPCNDGSVCTLQDNCDGAGKCVGAMPLKCDDLNPCTTDSCGLSTGCTATNNTLACNDNLFCTDKDTCAGGKCGSVTPKCNDGNVCTTDTCDETADKCAVANNTADCDDLDKCTPGDKCALAKCVAGKAIDCDDGNPCTLDSCNKLTGKCVQTLTTDALVCAPLSLARFWPIDNNDPLWVGKSNSQTVKWLSDATPAAPGKLTGLGSLNFNNGTDYADAVTGQVKGTATGKFYADATKVTGSYLTMAFYSWNGINDTGGADYDKRWVEFSTDGFVTIAASTQLNNTKNVGAWQLETIDIKALIGKSFQIRFRFDSVDGLQNTGKGWFVDHINIYLGPVVNWVAGNGVYNEPFDTNVNGWQYTAPVAGSFWAIDSTPALPLPVPSTLTASTLNFNNGTTFAGVTKGSALSPVVNLEALTTGPVTLAWKEWVSVEALDAFDQRTVQVSGDAFVTLPINATFKNNASFMGGWRWNWIDLSTLKGKKFRLLFSFDAKDDVNNTGKGWAIEDLHLSTLQAPSFGDMIICSNASAWTLANGVGPGWAVDTVGEVKAYSPDCSLNFNNSKANSGGKFDFACAANASKASGKATSPQFLVQTAPAGQKPWLTFQAQAAIESLAGVDVLTVTVTDVVAKQSTNFPIAKAAILNKWGEVNVDLTAFANKQVTVTFDFDSKDCTANTTAGVFIDNVTVRAK